MRRSSRTAAVAVVTVAGLAGSVMVTTTASADSESKNRARNVIYLLGDGMGRTHVTAGRERFYGSTGKMNMETMPAQGAVGTYAVNPKSGQPGSADFSPNHVPDSAATSTAWSSGVKTYNGALGIDAKGNVVPTLMEMAKQAGLRTGNVSNAEITDATPAGQFSHALKRNCQGPNYSASSCQNTAVTGSELPTSDIRVTPIADQIARNGTADVILGGGLSRFDAPDEKALTDQGYTVLGSISGQRVATRSDLSNARGEKVFGLFNTGNMTVEKYKRENPSAPQAAEPNLAEMTRKAIELLAQGKARGNGGGDGEDAGDDRKAGGKGFYLQVEGALIDKRSHANDAAQTLEEQKAFDDAVKVALDFAKKDGNTLVLVTADHECAGFNIIGKGSFSNAEAAAPPGNVDGGNPANTSTPRREYSGNVKDPGRSTGPVNGAGSGNPKNFGPATFRTPDDPAGVQDGSPDASLWLTYVSGNHTGADVPVYGFGPNSGAVARSIDNTALFKVVGNALGLVR